MKNGIKNIALASALVLTLGGGYAFASNSSSRAIVPLSPVVSVAPITSPVSPSVKEVRMPQKSQMKELRKALMTTSHFLKVLSPNLLLSE